MTTMEKIVQVDTYEAERKQPGALPPTPDGGMRNRRGDEEKNRNGAWGANKSASQETAKDIMENKGKGYRSV